MTSALALLATFQQHDRYQPPPKKKTKTKTKNRSVILPDLIRHHRPDDVPMPDGRDLLPGIELSNIALVEHHVAVTVLKARPVFREVDFVPGKQKPLACVRTQEIRFHRCAEPVRRFGFRAKHHLPPQTNNQLSIHPSVHPHRQTTSTCMRCKNQHAGLGFPETRRIRKE
jgi:hypothetical protein